MKVIESSITLIYIEFNTRELGNDYNAFCKSGSGPDVRLQLILKWSGPGPDVRL